MVTLSVVQWRARRLPGPDKSPTGKHESVGAAARKQRRYARAERAGTAASVHDRFLDVVVVLSVVVFLVLALGVGMLVLQAALRG